MYDSQSVHLSLGDSEVEKKYCCVCQKQFGLKRAKRQWQVKISRICIRNVCADCRRFKCQNQDRILVKACKNCFDTQIRQRVSVNFSQDISDKVHRKYQLKQELNLLESDKDEEASQIKILSTFISEQEEKITQQQLDMQRQIRDIERQKADIFDRMSKLRQKYQDSQQDLESKDSQIYSLKNEICTTKVSYAEFVSNKHNIQFHIEEQDKKNWELKEEINLKQSVHQELNQGKKGNLRNSFSRFQNQYKYMLAKRNDLKEKLRQISKDIDDKDERLRGLMRSSAGFNYQNLSFSEETTNISDGTVLRERSESVPVASSRLALLEDQKLEKNMEIKRLRYQLQNIRNSNNEEEETIVRDKCNCLII